jgi:hypothetical protein
MKCILRDNTPDPAEVRWDVLKSMLDDFPKLRDRTKQYLLEKKNSTRRSSNCGTDQSVKELLQNAIHEYRAPTIR